MATEKRLIDANKPIQETESIINFRMCHHMPVEDYESFLNYLKKQPTVDAVEVVHARNLRADSPSLFECSECGWSDCDTYTGDTAEYNYCPNCGAKMDGDGNVDA